jgi:hypothetical protein
MTPNNPGQEPKKPVISAYRALALVIAFQFFATVYCVHRIERATKTAAKEILDSMRLSDSISHVLDDTLQMNQGEIPDKHNSSTITNRGNGNQINVNQQ